MLPKLLILGDTFKYNINFLQNQRRSFFYILEDRPFGVPHGITEVRKGGEPGNKIGMNNIIHFTVGDFS
jgi:hypothetical protein